MMKVDIISLILLTLLLQLVWCFPDSSLQIYYVIYVIYEMSSSHTEKHYISLNLTVHLKSATSDLFLPNRISQNTYLYS